MQSITPQSSQPIRTAQQHDERSAASSPSMNKVAWLNRHGPSYFQKLPGNEKDRKDLIDWLIKRHNAGCSDPTNRIPLAQHSFSSKYPRLATWINTTFSDFSLNGMYLIAFALGRFADYHDLVTSRLAISEANTQVIEEWFQSYGTEACSKALTDLSHFMKATGKWDFLFEDDVRRLCTRVTPKAVNNSTFEPVQGGSSLNHNIATCYSATSGVFSQMYFPGGGLGFSGKLAASAFGLTGDEIDNMTALYQTPHRLVMASIDRFIRSGPHQSKLIPDLEACFKKWSEYDHSDGINCFYKALSTIDEMRAREAFQASLQSTGPKPRENAESSSMAGKNPAPGKSYAREDSYDLC